MRLRPLLSALLGFTLLGLQACGGDVTRVEDYHPQRILVLGDENSLVQATASGSKYTVNDPANCANNGVWVQALVQHYNMAFEACNPNGLSTTTHMQAQAGAKVADVATQAAAIGTAYASTDLITVFAGANDILAAFQDTTLSDDAMHARVREAGTLLAQQINTLIVQGAKVLFVTVPDLGLSPYGRNSGRQAVLSALCESFNKALRLSVQQDGSKAAIVLADSLVQRATESPGTYSLKNVKDAACAVGTPDCSSSTLVTDATSAGWMWADKVYLGPTLHARLGSLAITRATHNPF